jgi:hypothetical protein
MWVQGGLAAAGPGITRHQPTQVQHDFFKNILLKNRIAHLPSSLYPIMWF